MGNQLRVTLGERLRMARDVATIHQPRPPTDDVVPTLILLKDVKGDPVPTWVDPEVDLPVVRLRDARSSTSPWGSASARPVDPVRVTGHMEWMHKTAPVLVIHGRDAISPEEYAAGRRR